jgi:hypothetical protein
MLVTKQYLPASRDAVIEDHIEEICFRESARKNPYKQPPRAVVEIRIEMLT